MVATRGVQLQAGCRKIPWEFPWENPYMLLGYQDTVIVLPTQSIRADIVPPIDQSDSDKSPSHIIIKIILRTSNSYTINQESWL